MQQNNDFNDVRAPTCIALLAAANSIHTVKWANGLADKGITVHLWTLHHPSPDISSQVHVHVLPWGSPAGYVAAARRLRHELNQIRPQLLNAHYATGYGLLARLSGYAPTLLSVWGSDIYDFPNKSAWHRKLVARNLEFATLIGSTSHAMAQEISKLKDGPIAITPFGVDPSQFPARKHDACDADSIMLGTIKALEPQYGIDTFLRAVQIVLTQLRRNHPEIAGRIQVRIYGKGHEHAKLQALTRELGIAGQVTFAGFIDHDKVPAALNELDVYVALSRRDSFGVAILEACSCSVPVVVSSADGPAEIVNDQESGFIVPVDDPGFAAARILDLVLDPALRERLGRGGRQRVLDEYTWEHSVQTMLDAYRQTLVLAHHADEGRAPAP
ncbi:MAG: glycosyltransferase family 4 protein [Achromobacter sp.]|nr:glycosyltransferase family 4 protein [Achromobacter sp.]